MLEHRLKFRQPADSWRISFLLQGSSIYDRKPEGTVASSLFVCPLPIMSNMNVKDDKNYGK